MVPGEDETVQRSVRRRSLTEGLGVRPLPGDETSIIGVNSRGRGSSESTGVNKGIVDRRDSEEVGSGTGSHPVCFQG